MKITVMSDIHLEFRSLEVENPDGADVLVLAGDIFVADDFTAPSDIQSSRYDKAVIYRKFLNSASANYNYVIYIAGNHEFYHGSWHKSRIILRDECEKYSNIFFLDNDYIFVNQVLFLGSTLWTDMNMGNPIAVMTAQDLMNDYRVIKNDKEGYRKLRVSDTIKEHIQSITYISDMLEKYEGTKTVIVTHHAPTFASVSKEYVGDALNPAYYSNLEDIMYENDNIALWCHGHIHSPSDYLVGMTRVVANPLGYPGEHNRVTLYKTVEI